MFKVVPDQLNVSDGWVRCGHCDGVFDATAHFQSSAESEALKVSEAHVEEPAQSATTFPAIDEPSPITVPLTLPPAAALPGAVVGESPKDFFAELNPVDRSEAPVGARFVTHSHWGDASVSAPLSSYLSAPESADFPAHDDHTRSQEGAERRALYGSTKSYKPSSSAKSEDARRQSLPEVTFVQAAQRRDSQKGPLYKVMAALFALVLLGALALQVLLHKRDYLAASYPALLPALGVVCQKMGCQINPPRVIEAIMIDSSSFTQTGADAYRLNVVLKNTQPTVVAMPALEVTLMGSQKEVLLRKVLFSADIGATSNRLEPAESFAGVFNLLVGLPPLSVAPLQAVLSADTAIPGGQAVVEAPAAAALVTGYRVFAFYP